MRGCHFPKVGISNVHFSFTRSKFLDIDATPYYNIDPPKMFDLMKYEESGDTTSIRFQTNNGIWFNIVFLLGYPSYDIFN